MFLSEKEREETIWACRFCMMCHCADRVGQVVRRESYTPREEAGATLRTISQPAVLLLRCVFKYQFDVINTLR